MAKELFHTSDKSNFIVNLDMERYRAISAKLMLASLWVTAASEGINQMTESVNSKLSVMIADGGAGGIVALLLVGLRSIAAMFSIMGVLAFIWMFIGIVRKQLPKSSVPLYIMLAVSMLWGFVSLCHSYSTDFSLFGQDGRDEGLIVLIMYAAFFYLGTMLRRKEYAGRFLSGVLIFGIVQNVWALLQMQPFFDFPSAYKRVEALSYQNLRLPCGLTDSPVTFAMLLAMLLCIAVPAAFYCEKPLHRILAAVCAGLSFLSVFKTSTVAGWIAGIGGVLVLIAVVIIRRGAISGKKWIAVGALAFSVCLSLCWTYFSPAINNSISTVNDQQIDNGFYLFDGGIVWDDAYYRLSTSGPYSLSQKPDFDIFDSCSVLKYCWSEGWRVVKIDPVFGVGPDNFSFTQLHSSMTLIQNPNSIDRPYNDYLFIAGTRGILAALIHIAVVVWSVVLAWKKRRDAAAWVYLSATGAAVLYAVTAFVGISVLTVAPLFWMLLGIAAAELLPADTGKAWQKQKKKKKQKQSTVKN